MHLHPLWSVKQSDSTKVLVEIGNYLNNTVGAKLDLTMHIVSLLLPPSLLPPPPPRECKL